MARPKTKKVRKAVIGSVPPSTAPIETGPAKFPLNRMPAELVHMICGYLNPIEVAKMRIMSSTISAIGLEYIATTVTLTLKEDSFDRLLEIAHHPVISRYVHSIHYEHDFLTEFDRRKWEKTIRTPALMAVQYGYTKVRAPKLNASERDWRAFYRKCAALQACNTYGKRRLDQAFLTYQKHCAEQHRARRSGFFSNKMIDAFQHLPNLRTIYMPTHGSYSRYQREIAKFLDGAFYDQPTIESNSVAVTRSILLAVDQAIRGGQNRNIRAARVGHGAALRASSRTSSTASDDGAVGGNQVSTSLGSGIANGGCTGGNDLGGNNQRVLQIKNFNSESLNWRLLLEDDGVFTVMKRSISHLTKLGIRLLNGHYIKDTESRRRSPNDREAANQCFRRGRLYEFVKSAPCLQELSVAFDLNNEHLTIYLMDVVGYFHWESLKTVHFQRIKISVDNLAGFCSRHSSTLSNLSLGDLQMHRVSPYPGRDPWYSMFTNIREATKLKEASVYGVFEILELWDMHDHEDVRRTSGTLIGRYLVGEGGNSSLKDFLEEEYSRISEQDRESSVSDIDYGSIVDDFTSESEDSSSESDA